MSAGMETVSTATDLSQGAGSLAAGSCEAHATQLRVNARTYNLSKFILGSLAKINICAV